MSAAEGAPRLKGQTAERFAVSTVGSPETSDISNNPDRRVALTTPAVLIIPDITTSSFGCGEEEGWGGGGEVEEEVPNPGSMTSSGSSG